MNLLKHLLIIVPICICTKSFSQTDKKESILSGVYLSYKDFQSGKLTYQIDCSKEKFVIKLQDFFSKAYIDVIRDGRKHTLQKNEVYGYRDCDNTVYRFYDNKEFQVAEARNISIYINEQRVPDGKGFRTEKKYYFSRKPDGEIKPLTIENLKIAFPDNQKFHELLVKNFTNESDVSAYDSAHKMFKVNLIYEMSLKESVQKQSK